MRSLFVLLSCVFGVSVAQNVNISPVGAVTVVEGNNLTITCTDGAFFGGVAIALREDGVYLTGDDTPPNEVNGVFRIFHLLVNRTENGNTYDCISLITAMISPVITLTVVYQPRFSPATASATPIEGEHIMISLSINANPLPTIDNTTLTKNGAPVSDTRFIVTATSLTIANLTRDDSGVYQITASNVVGSDTFTLTVDVYYSPEFTFQSQNVTRFATGVESFTFDCTPSGGNPAVYSYTFRKGSVVVTEGVSGSVLTINLVVRGNRGVYTCEANNTVGRATITQNLFINVPPTMPLNPRVADLMPSSATLQWDPPSDDGYSSLPLTYTATLTNTSTSLSFPDTTVTSLLLTNLQHSTQYNWSVQAMNEYGTSPSAVNTFITMDSVPIIASVEAAVLSLFEMEVNISLFTNGGQIVAQYTVEVRGEYKTFPSSEQMQVSLLVNQLSVNFTKGERLTVRAFAVNSVGTSDPVSVEVIVPFPPSTTAPPTELTSTDVPVCCAGVQLYLENPDNRIDVRVLVDGTFHPANQVVRDRDSLYIMGLQAGTEYSLNIALMNIFGTVCIHTTVRPLLGRPSSPQVTLTPTAGSLRVQLTTMYPGTRESTLQYSISTLTSPRSRRQTGQQTLPVTDLTTPVRGSEEVALGPGTYSVTVTVTNQHGPTTSVPQEVTIPGSTGQPLAVIALSVALVIVTLLLAVTSSTTIFFCLRSQKLSSILKDVKGSNSHCDEMEMGPQSLPKSHSKSTTEPQYEVCGGGVTSTDLAMEENPAYQSMDVATAKP